MQEKIIAFSNFFDYCLNNQPNIKKHVKTYINEVCNYEKSAVIIDNIFKSWVYNKYSTSSSDADDDSKQSFSVDEDLDAEFFDRVKNKLGEITLMKQDKIEMLIKVLKSSMEYIRYDINTFSALKSTKDTSYQIQTHIDDLKKEAKLIKKDLKNQSRKNIEASVTILGIFVSVVMVFFGGFSILTQAITTMNSVTPYRLVFTILMFGLIMYNIVILLFFLISKITGKKIHSKCYRYKPKDAQRSKDCLNCAKSGIVLGLCRIEGFYPYIYWGNTVIIAGLTFTFAMWVHFKLTGDVNNLKLRIFIGIGAAVAVILMAFFIPKLLYILKCLKNFKQNESDTKNNLPNENMGGNVSVDS